MRFRKKKDEVVAEEESEEETVTEEEETVTGTDDDVADDTEDESEDDTEEDADESEEDESEEESDDDNGQDEDGDNGKGGAKKPATPSTGRRIVRAVLNYPKWVYTTIYNWFNGTEEHPLPFLGLRDRFKCWRMTRHGYIYLRVMTFNRRTKWWEIKEDLVKRREMPEESVHCTNEKKTFLLSLEPIKFDPREDYGFGAHNAYNYMRDNSFEEAQMAAGEEKQGIPLRYLGILAIGGIAIFMYLLTVM